MLRGLLIAIVPAAVVAAALLWWMAARWRDRTEPATDPLIGEVVDQPDPLTDELWTFTRELQPARIYDELAYAQAWDWKHEMELAA